MDAGEEDNVLNESGWRGRLVISRSVMLTNLFDGELDRVTGVNEE